jgi:lysophospholipase L1-like esterase
VRNVIILIGANDFASWNGTYGEIYYNKITDAQVSGKVKKMVADITAAVDTVRTSRTVPMVISTIPNRSVTQPFLDRYPDPAKRMRVTNAVRAVNDGIIAMATAKGIAVADLLHFQPSCRPVPTRMATYRSARNSSISGYPEMSRTIYCWGITSISARYSMAG